MNPDDTTLGDVGAVLGEALGEQVELQFEVAKAELAHDARAMIRDLAPLALALPVAVLGFVFLLVGVALALAPWVGAAVSVLVVGGALLAAAAVAGRLALSNPASRWMLPASRAGGYRVR